MTDGPYGVSESREVDWNRKETDPCQRGTVGCCVDHDIDKDDSCEVW